MVDGYVLEEHKHPSQEDDEVEEAPKKKESFASRLGNKIREGVSQFGRGSQRASNEVNKFRESQRKNSEFAGRTLAALRGAARERKGNPFAIGGELPSYDPFGGDMFGEQRKQKVRIVYRTRRAKNKKRRRPHTNARQDNFEDVLF